MSQPQLPQRIAIIGSQGQLGGELCRLLGTQAIPLDQPDIDITDRDGTVATLLRVRPDAVINTAAYTLVDPAEDNRELAFAINATGVDHLAAACAQLDCPLLHISTDYVFGADDSRRTPYLETDRPCPQGAYAQSKLAGELVAARWHKHFIVRTCGLYGRRGANTRSANFVDTMLRLGRERGHVRVVHDQHCTPTYVPHVAQACLFLLTTTTYGIYNVVNSGGTTWHDFAVEIFRQANLPVTVEPITTAAYGAKAARPAYSVLDTTKYHALGGPPLPAWPSALAEYLRAATNKS